MKLANFRFLRNAIFFFKKVRTRLLSLSSSGIRAEKNLESESSGVCHADEDVAGDAAGETGAVVAAVEAGENGGAFEITEMERE